MYKKYVDVIMLNNKQGEICPLYLKWENQMLKIEQSDCIGMRNSPVGATGVLYVCRIRGKLRNLYHEKKSRWFVESSIQ